jgi:hypothetical protein
LYTNQSFVDHKSESYDDESNMPFPDSEEYNNNPRLYDNEDNDNSGLDNEDYDDEMNNIETESDCSKTSEISLYNSEENDESTEFEESKMTNISDGTVDAMFVNYDFDNSNN